MAQTTYIAQQWSSKFNYTIDVLRLHQRWGWFSNVCDFYMRLGEDKFLAWYKIFEKENSVFLNIIDERERELRELENTISDKLC